MNKYAIILTSTAIALVAAVGTASARGERPSRVPDREELTPRCVQIGSGIWECEFCTESEADQLSVCEKYITKNDTHAP